MRDSGHNVILEKSVLFSLKLIEYVEILEKDRKFVIANQLLRSGTSIGANISEAQDAESKADFIHKMKLASKELNETIYWFKLCQNSLSYPDCNSLNNELEEIRKILNAILGSLKKNENFRVSTLLKLMLDLVYLRLNRFSYAFSISLIFTFSNSLIIN